MVFIPSISSDAPVSGGDTLTEQQGAGFDWGGAAQAAGGATKTLVGLFNAGRKKKLKKKAEKVQQAYERAQFDASIKNSLEDEAGILRTAEQQEDEIGSHYAGRGITESSDENYSRSMHTFNRDVHLNALRQQRALMRHGYEARQKIRDIQKKLEKIEHQEAVIAASIDTAISVAGIVCDRNAKVVVEEVDPAVVLHRLMTPMLKISRFEYKPGMGPSGEHIGPMAQDFHKAFGVGSDPKRIDTVDAFGVALACIQAQAKQIDALGRRVWSLEQERMTK